ncbi:MAG: 50S ribosomal protein L10 [Bacteroidales bacterium]|jgi:large subunit ribosomal protein L10|nr:50S ribosomal protein L10 [Bacteroidales bacterium]MCI2122130.1 50S ribosomal protein L10 [Bacteroidales bacterium]MCI2145314.1 50S ribosomal protein L10 [Bacteroidales bacterium]
MKKEVKSQIIDSLKAQFAETPNFYVASMEGLNSEDTSTVRRECFKNGVKLVVVKNTLFKKVLADSNNAEAQKLETVLEGQSAIMFTTVPNAPAKIMKKFETSFGKPQLKGAYVQECVYIGSENLDALVNLKSHDELIGDVIAMLQSPVRNVLSALESAGDKLGGIVKTLSEKEENK